MSKKRKVEHPSNTIQEIHPSRLKKVVYILSWEEIKEEDLTQDGTWDRHLKIEEKSKKLLLSYGPDKKIVNMFDCTDFMHDKGNYLKNAVEHSDKNNKNDTCDTNVWRMFWGCTRTKYALPDIKPGDKFYIIENYTARRVLRMQLRGVTLTDIVQDADFEYIKFRLKQYMNDQVLSRLLQFDETDVVELTFNETNNRSNTQIKF